MAIVPQRHWWMDIVHSAVKKTFGERFRPLCFHRTHNPFYKYYLHRHMKFCVCGCIHALWNCGPTENRNFRDRLTCDLRSVAQQSYCWRNWAFFVVPQKRHERGLHCWNLCLCSIKHSESYVNDLRQKISHPQARIQKCGLGGRFWHFLLRNGAFWRILEHVLDQLGNCHYDVHDISRGRPRNFCVDFSGGFNPRNPPLNTGLR